jgi:hypothetical protein
MEQSPKDNATPKLPTRNWLLIIGVTLVLIVVARHSPSVSPSESSPPDAPSRQEQVPETITVRYVVESACPTNLTYMNASGGTEQVRATVNPWIMAFERQHQSFVSLSAQMDYEYCPRVTVRISAGQKIIQEATSTERYGIASASGLVP